MAVFAGFGIMFFALMLLLGLLYFMAHVLFALAAYHDAQAQGNPDALVWGLAIGILGFIPGIIYLCIRGSGRRLVRCPNCGYPHDAVDFCCPKCGEKNSPAPKADPYQQVLAERARKELIGGIVVIAAGVLVTILAVIFFSFSIMGSWKLF
ncbi:MAG: zinc ribbon domain-containing protein [Oscillospiraceae bacterium]|nr:zinc ribbon domain-containing protein [Oscillospiraceae bacterium]